MISEQPTVNDELKALYKAVSVTREALAFYADPETHRARFEADSEGVSGDVAVWPILLDSGTRAREALEQIDAIYQTLIGSAEATP